MRTGTGEGRDDPVGRALHTVSTEDQALGPEAQRAALDSWAHRQGVTLVADTCIVVTPILREISGILMTNSGKFAHYAPGNTGYSVQYGAMADCVESAVSGQLTRDERLWA